MEEEDLRIYCNFRAYNIIRIVSFWVGFGQAEDAGLMPDSFLSLIPHFNVSAINEQNIKPHFKRYSEFGQKSLLLPPAL